MRKATRRKILKFISVIAVIIFVLCGGAVVESLPFQLPSMENPYFVLSLLAGGWLTLMIWLTN